MIKLKFRLCRQAPGFKTAILATTEHFIWNLNFSETKIFNRLGKDQLNYDFYFESLSQRKIHATIKTVLNVCRYLYYISTSTLKATCTDCSDCTVPVSLWVRFMLVKGNCSVYIQCIAGHRQAPELWVVVVPAGLMKTNASPSNECLIFASVGSRSPGIITQPLFFNN